jgi:hypothetical protein
VTARGARLLVLALACSLCALAGPAHAAGRLIRIHDPKGGSARLLAGPVFAGKRLAWSGRLKFDRYHVTTLAGGTSTTRFIHVDVPRGSQISFMNLEASAERAGVGLDVERCDNYCRGSRFGEPTIEFEGALTAPLEQPFGAPVTDCKVVPDLGGAPPSIDVTEDVLMSPLCDGGLRVRDYADGATPAKRDFLRFNSGRIAGSFLLARDPEPSYPSGANDLVLVNWRTGAELLRIADTGAGEAGYVLAYDVQADGKVVTLEQTPTENRYRLFWRVPGDPAAHPIGGELAGRSGMVRVAADRVAFTRPPLHNDRTEYGVRTLDGQTLLAQRYVEGGHELDFDGERLAWATRPCGLAALAEWDVKDAPPRLPAGRCPFPRVVSGSARLDRKHHLRLELACPQRPARGCSRTVTAPFPSGSSGGSLDPAEHGNVRFPIKPKDVACIDKRGRTRVSIELYAWRRPADRGMRSKSRTVIAKGPKPSAPDCA